jgi:hypothetical protein
MVLVAVSVIVAIIGAVAKTVATSIVLSKVVVGEKNSVAGFEDAMPEVFGPLQPAVRLVHRIAIRIMEGHFT